GPHHPEQGRAGPDVARAVARPARGNPLDGHFEAGPDAGFSDRARDGRLRDLHDEPVWLPCEYGDGDAALQQLCTAFGGHVWRVAKTQLAISVRHSGISHQAGRGIACTVSMCCRSGGQEVSPRCAWDCGICSNGTGSWTGDAARIWPLPVQQFLCEASSWDRCEVGLQDGQVYLGG